MAGHAGGRRVLARERKVCLAVVVRCRCPPRRGVATLTRGREFRGTMWRRRGCVVLRLVATRAQHGLAAEHVVAVTARTGYGAMTTRECKSRGVVIERRAGP